MKKGLFFILAFCFIILGPPIRADSLNTEGNIGFIPNPSLEQKPNIPENTGNSTLPISDSRIHEQNFLPRTGDELATPIVSLGMVILIVVSLISAYLRRNKLKNINYLER